VLSPFDHETIPLQHRLTGVAEGEGHMATVTLCGVFSARRLQAVASYANPNVAYAGGEKKML
jgi:hypothetical protein